MTWSFSTRIEILGAVRAWRGSHELALGSPQQRSVLALLAAADGEPLATTEIVETLWDGHPPRTAANVVQTYLKRLRRALEPQRAPRDPSQVLPAVGRGYALRVDLDAVDLWRFRRLLRQAAQARRDSDFREALPLLTDAVSLWKGPPGGGLPAVSHYHRLRAATEEYGTAVGWFAEASLRTGSVAEAIPTVARAAAVRPFDEPLHAHLIRLYHAAGRRWEAMLVYHGSRQALRDELGLDPGTELTGAYRDLLAEQPPWSVR